MIASPVLLEWLEQVGEGNRRIAQPFLDADGCNAAGDEVFKAKRLGKDTASFQEANRGGRYDTIINLHWSRPLADLSDLRHLLHRHSRKAVCASQRSHEGYEGTDLSYRLLMRDPERLEDLLTELRALQGVSRVTGLKAEEESEI